jgi:hypothetical protein
MLHRLFVRHILIQLVYMWLGTHCVYVYNDSLVFNFWHCYQCWWWRLCGGDITSNGYCCIGFHVGIIIILEIFKKLIFWGRWWTNQWLSTWSNNIGFFNSALIENFQTNNVEKPFTFKLWVLKVTPLICCMALWKMYNLACLKMYFPWKQFGQQQKKQLKLICVYFFMQPCYCFVTTTCVAKSFFRNSTSSSPLPITLKDSPLLDCNWRCELIFFNH